MTRFGNPLDAPTITHRFQALLKRGGIGHHHSHDLRHTAATLLAVQDVHPRAYSSGTGLGKSLDEPLCAFRGRTAASRRERDGLDFASVVVKVAVNAKAAKLN